MLTDSQIRAAKPAKKQFKIWDQRGLYVAVTPAGSKIWRYRFYFNAKESTLSLGRYPTVRAPEARKRRDKARDLIDQGINPAIARRQKIQEQCDSFKSLALEFFERQGCDKDKRRLELYIFPALGSMPVKGITAPDLLACLRRIEKRKLIETAHRTRSICSRVFRYGIACGRVERDPAADLIGTLKKVESKRLPALTEPADVAALLRAINAFDALPQIQLAMRLLPYVFVRPGELRQAEWDEINGDIWRIPAEKMKMDKPHEVPLSRQAQAILDELRQWTMDSRYLFPSIRSRHRCISANTLNVSLRRMGYSKDQMCAHGFRRITTSLLNRLRYRWDAIEFQMAHVEKGTRASYMRDPLIDERIEMMQGWADYLDQLRDETNVATINRKSQA